MGGRRAADRRRRQPDGRRRARARPGRERERRASTVAASAVQRALNVRLPADIRVLGVDDATPGFHARFHAVAQVLSLPDRDDAGAVAVRSVLRLARAGAARHRGDAAAPRRVLVGRHDFASFQARGAFVRDDGADAPAARRPRRRAARSSSRSTATGSCATWSAPSSARSPRSAPGPGRRPPSRRCCTRAIGRRPDRPRRRRG